MNTNKGDNKMKEQGFSLIDATVTVAIVGLLSVIAHAGYKSHVGKSQATEAHATLGQTKAKVIESLAKNGECFSAGENVFKAKYGSLEISGEVVKDALNNNKVLLNTGCSLKYTFGTNVAPKLKGKILEVDVFNNGVLSLSDNTTLDAKFIDKKLTQLTEDEKPSIVVQEPEPEPEPTPDPDPSGGESEPDPTPEPPTPEEQFNKLKGNIENINVIYTMDCCSDWATYYVKIKFKQEVPKEYLPTAETAHKFRTMKTYNTGSYMESERVLVVPGRGYVTSTQLAEYEFEHHIIDTVNFNNQTFATVKHKVIVDIGKGTWG